MLDFVAPRVSRRAFLEAAAALGGALLLPPRAAWSAGEFRASETARAAIAESPLVYIAPLRSDGSESSCHAEVWFVPDGGDLLVATTLERWRARAVKRGLDRARLWVGDFGPWKKSQGKFKTAPTFLARAEFVPGADAAIERALARFGSKYSDGWENFGPRFRSGLADGSRVLIRYRPVAA